MDRDWDGYNELSIWHRGEIVVLEEVVDRAVAGEDELKQAHESRRAVSLMRLHLL